MHEIHTCGPAFKQVGSTCSALPVVDTKRKKRRAMMRLRAHLCVAYGAPGTALLGWLLQPESNVLQDRQSAASSPAVGVCVDVLI